MSATDARGGRRVAGSIVLALISAAIVIGLLSGRRSTEHTQGSAPPRPENAETVESVGVAVADSDAGMVGPAAPVLVSQRVPTPSRQVRTYDRRNLEEMAHDWAGEVDDPEWTLNVRTFVQAMIDTTSGVESRQAPELFSIRCRQSVCRLDSDGGEPALLRELFSSARAQQAHVNIRLNSAASGTHIEAYLGREPASPDSR